MNKTYFMTEMIRSGMDRGNGFPSDAKIKEFSDAYDRNQHLFLETESENQSSNQSGDFDKRLSNAWIEIESLKSKVAGFETDRSFIAAVEKEKFDQELERYKNHTATLSKRCDALEDEFKSNIERVDENLGLVSQAIELLSDHVKSLTLK